MRTALLLALAAGCSFHLHADDGAGSDASGTTSLVDDTASDFSADETLADAVIDPGGSIEPAAFVPGGLHARSYPGNLVAGATSWTDIDNAATATAMIGEAYQQLPIDWGNSHPRGLAMTVDDNWTVVYDGEIQIPAGDHMLSFDVDDDGAIEIAQQFLITNLNTQTFNLHEDVATWVPLHAAIGENGGNARLVVKLDGTQLTADQTRARVNQAHGLLTTVYYAASSTTEAVTGAFVAAPNVNWGMTAPPYDLVGPSTSYTARFMGQLEIAADGTYTFATTTGSVDDSTALYIDRHLVTRTSPFPDSHPASAAVMLTAGWHSIVVELSGSQKNALGGTDPHAVTIATTINGSPLTADLLRPAVESGYFAQAVSAYVPLNDTNANGGVTSITIPGATPAPPAGATIDSTLLGYVYYHAANTDYTVVANLGSSAVPVPSTGAVVVADGDETAAGMPVPTASAWSFTFTDTVPGDSTGYVDPYALVFAGYTFHGGPDKPFATQVMYVSSARSLPGITAFGALRVFGNFDGATATIAVRTASTAQDLISAGWVDVENGTIPTAEPLPYLQYRIVFAGDGWQFPVVDKVELDYTR